MDGGQRKLRLRAEQLDQRTLELQFLRDENRFLRADRDRYRRQCNAVDEQLLAREEQVKRLTAENAKLRRQVEQLQAKAAAAAAGGEDAPPPGFVKPSVDPHKRRKRPGRKAGHPAALRPMPEQIDLHQDVPLPKDDAGRDACPKCHCALIDRKSHARIIEDLIPAKVLVTCYHTTSGYCLMCRKRVESRHPQQPPAPLSDLPHGQLGVNALSTAAVLRIVHRLPMRQVCQVLANLSRLSVSPGAIAKQLQRLGRWLDPYYERILLALRGSPHVHADETGWRTDGTNGYLWTLTNPTHTLYHVDDHRSGAVINDLLGDAFGGTLVADFYAAYNALDCRKQRCLVHLLREFKETAEQHPAFAASRFCRDAAKLVKQMLALKRRWSALADAVYTTRVCRLEATLSALAHGTYEEPNAMRLAKRMRKHARELTAFLWDRDLDGTNNAAERALRPAVVARKISGGSRSAAGAAAWAKLASLMQTAAQQGQNVLEVVKQLLIEHWAGGPAMALTAGP
jgi:hypothetical protein